MKKNFANAQNPALDFISAATNPTAKQDTSAQSPDGVAIPAGYKLVKDELRNKQLHISIYPSLYAELEKEARAQGVSVSTYIQGILMDRNK